MATLTWIAGLSGQWITVANWSPAQVPVAGDTALINQSGAYQVTLNTAAEVANLTMADAFGVLNVSGTLQVDNGLTISAGTLGVTGTLNAAGFSNAGSLLDQGNVTLSGTMTAASLQNIGAQSNSGGFLTVNGTVLNAGGTLDGSSLNTLTVLNSGTIIGGVVVNRWAENQLAVDGVTWRGPLDMSFGGTLTVTDGLTLTGADGTGPDTLTLGKPALNGTNVVTFTNSQTFDHAVVSSADIGSITAGTTLILGNAATFDLLPTQLPYPESWVFSGGTFISRATIAASFGDGTENVISNPPLSFTAADFENAGLISAVDATGAYFHDVGLLISDTTFVNRAGGLIETGQSVGVGSITIAGTTAFANNGTILTQAPSAMAGGTIDIAAFVAGSGTIEVSGGGLAILESGAAGAQSIDFTGTGTVTLDAVGSLAAPINGFGPGDTIEMNVGATAVSYGGGDLKMQVIGSATTFDLAITGTHSLADFIIGHPSNTSTAIQLACFAAGTRIATPDGFVPAEQLSAGDLVTVADRGPPLPVAWIGHRAVDCDHHPKPESVWPVRIAAAAFAPGIPARDLYLSPDHAVFADGVLIPVRYLVNANSISRVQRAHITYYHVALPRHAVVLAEGLTVESLLPTTDRSAFTNGGAVTQLYPDFNSLAWEALGCAPLVVTGPAVEAVRTRLARRQERMRRYA